MERLKINSQNIEIHWLEKVAAGKVLLELTDEAIEKIQHCRRYLDEKMQKATEPIYGITTGFGALYNRTISTDQLSQLQKNLVVSHACGQGAEVSPQIVRLMLYLKAYALSLGHSGVQLQTVQRIVDMYNQQVLPVVYEQGSLGASGDLAPLAHLFLPILGEGEVRYQGKKMPAQQANSLFGWNEIVLQSKEGLALLNGTQFMSAHGVVTLLRGHKIIELSDKIAACSIDAFDGRIEPFGDNLQQIRPHRGQIETAEHIRNFLKGSEIISRPKKHVQDPYSFRCVPQVHGATKDALRYFQQVMLTEINSVTDNPTIFIEEDMVVSGGNFHGQPLALAFDFIGIAIAELASISERRTYRLIAGQRELPEFLVANPGLNSGFMIPQYLAAGIVSQNKQLCTPASVDSISSSNEQEDHVSMGANAATKTLRILDNVERVLAIELFNAAQALEFRRPLKTSPVLEEFIANFRKKVPFVQDDVVMYQHIDESVRFFRSHYTIY